jgi:hypothetical protein
MKQHARVSIIFVLLALLCVSAQCESKKKTEQQKQSEQDRAAREEAERRRKEAEHHRDEAEKRRDAAEQEAAVWKTYCVISLIVTIAVLAVWVFSTAPQASEGIPAAQQGTTLPRKLSVALLVALVAQAGGLIGGFVLHEFGAVVASVGASLCALAGSSRSPHTPSRIESCAVEKTGRWPGFHLSPALRGEVGESSSRVRGLLWSIGSHEGRHFGTPPICSSHAT